MDMAEVYVYIIDYAEVSSIPVGTTFAAMFKTPVYWEILLWN